MKISILVAFLFANIISGCGAKPASEHPADGPVAAVSAPSPTETDIEAVSRVTRALQRAALDAEDAQAAFEKADPARRAYREAGAAQSKVLGAIAARIKSTPECFEAALRGEAQKSAREVCARSNRLWSFDQRTGVAVIVGGSP